MSKKKSYMDIKNIITEAIFQKLFKWLLKKPELKDSKKFKGSINKLNTSIKSFENDINSELKKLDSKSEKINNKTFYLKG